MKQPGKVPSIYNRHNELIGLTGWTQRVTTEAEIDQWMKAPDYGLGLQTRRVRALDVDVTDSGLAGRIAAFIEARHPALPRRQRPDSPKFLLAFVCAPGEQIAKRRVTTEHDGVIEFLATGQQFVATGTHPDGARYEWARGLPAALPTLTLEQFEVLWGDLCQEFGTGASIALSTAQRQREPDIKMDDPIADHIEGMTEIFHGREP